MSRAARRRAEKARKARKGTGKEPGKSHRCAECGCHLVPSRTAFEPFLGLEAPYPDRPDDAAVYLYADHTSAANQRGVIRGGECDLTVGDLRRMRIEGSE